MYISILTCGTVMMISDSHIDCDSEQIGRFHGRLIKVKMFGFWVEYHTVANCVCVIHAYILSRH